MRYLIDTYNLLHAAIAHGGPLGDMSVRKLCRYLSAAPRQVQATLILDGRAKPDEPSLNEFPDLTLLYSGAGVKADTVIAQLIEASTTRKKLTVVTDDRAVALHARRFFAHAMSCDQFIRQLTQYAPGAASHEDPAHKSLGTPTAGESDHWMKEFGLTTDPNPQQRLPTSQSKKDLDPLADIHIEDLLGPRD